MALVAEGLTKAYRRRPVVSDVSFSVERGQIVGLLGPNGAGKTTSFYMVLGLVRADRGRVLLDGRDITGLPMHLRCRQGLGYLAQEPSVFRKLSVRENLLLVLEMVRIPKRDRSDRADALLVKLGLTRIANTRCYLLSGGERRRVELARTLCTSPSFILLDEPFTGVDPMAIDDIKEILTGLRREDIGILITDHNVRDTLGITHRAYIISEGRVRTHGASDELVDDPIARQHYLGDRFHI